MAMVEARLKDGPDWLTGQVLIAMPAMRDPRFVQTVIFICAHTAEGAMGVVLNRPLKRPRFADLLEQLGVEPNPPKREIRLGTGGPVDDNRGFVLHSADWTADGSLPVDGDYVLTANLEVLHAIASGGGPQRGILLLGYAGWEAGQLDEEIKQNAWLSAAPDEALVYDSQDQTKWARALAKLRIDPGMLSGEAGRA
jgi:putative transcriptional regulator